MSLALFGAQLTEASPYQTHGVKTIDGEIGAPPFPPSSVFPWGTDPLGRDLKALVLAGAAQSDDGQAGQDDEDHDMTESDDMTADQGDPR